MPPTEEKVYPFYIKAPVILIGLFVFSTLR